MRQPTADENFTDEVRSMRITTKLYKLIEQVDGGALTNYIGRPEKIGDDVLMCSKTGGKSFGKLRIDDTVVASAAQSDDDVAAVLTHKIQQRMAGKPLQYFVAVVVVHDGEVRCHFGTQLLVESGKELSHLYNHFRAHVFAHTPLEDHIAKIDKRLDRVEKFVFFGQNMDVV